MAEPVQVEGLGQLRASLARLARALPGVAPADAARVIGQQARVNTPKRTGRLASSWAADTSPGVQGLSFGNSGLRYAAPVHWGVGPRVGLRGPHNIRPSLYLLRAIESTQEIWVGEYQQEIETLTGKVRGA